ncbi:MAG TPA: prolyl oligopeptidase family serine peptidase [Pyrinomonadaceae bacterium]|nr:prolyl oligopeptidase family serine peptidase [Pyrinomonadaceae bacterium]
MTLNLSKRLAVSRTRGRRVLAALLLLAALGFSAAAQTYQKPPQAVLDVLNAPVPPVAVISPARDYMLLVQGVRYPPISELAQPMLRLAGLRINPNTTGPHRDLYFVGATLKKVADGTERKLELPAGAKIGVPVWSTDGKRFAFTNTTAGGIELWAGEAASGRVWKLKGVVVNAVYGTPVQWMPDNRTLLVETVPAKRGAPPAEDVVPKGPTAQESSGRRGPVRTYEDLLKNAHDEDLFDYYATSQLAFVDSESGKATPLGKPAVYESAEPSPDGSHLLVARLHRPYSYLHPADDFPKDVEVWDREAKVVHKVVSRPLADDVPIEGVVKGPRDYEWRPGEGATLVWAEALDEGDPRKKVSPRDRVLMLKAPFAGQPVELIKTEQRFVGAQWDESGQAVLVRDYDRDKRWVRTQLLEPDKAGSAPRVVWSHSVNERYNNPGTPLARILPDGRRLIIRSGDFIYLTGAGSSPEGDRPFLDRLNLQTLKTERLFRSDAQSYETVVALVTPDAHQVITRRERPIEPANYYVRTLPEPGSSTDGAADSSGLKALTNFPDPTPQLQGIKKQLVKYKRADGVDLSFTLYLPPGYKEGTRLPTVVWAYPLEFNDPTTAGQVTGSTQRYNSIVGPSHLFFLLAGYAVLDNATMPIVGDPETMNNTYVEQIVASAKAAIDKAAEMGVTDPERVGVGGHSYGAFMTANLLAHSDLFRAGIARSGAYNRTLTPFGFQSERRTLWEAPEMYIKVSPFMVADKINEPILLIHGEADNNTGTFPIQSERMYQAIRGNGGTVRYVTLPFEAHGYAARETTEHVLYEMINWFDKYVKNAPPRRPVAQSEK